MGQIKESKMLKSKKLAQQNKGGVRQEKLYGEGWEDEKRKLVPGSDSSIEKDNSGEKTQS